MAQLSLVLCDLDLNPLPQEWAVEQILAATIVLEELDRFSPHSITVSGSFRTSLTLLTGLTAVQIIDGDVGTIAYGLLDDPEDQITADDGHTITLQLPNITDVLRYSTTGQGWVAGYVPPVGSIPGPHGGYSGLSLKQMVQRIGALRYGWSADVVDYGDTGYVLRFEDATLLGALVQTAEATGGHARQGHAPDGTPQKRVEIGIFGAGPAVQIITPDGANANDILANNPEARLAQTITRHPADCSKLVNVMTPLGGGQGVNQVRFRRLFRILFDPSYTHWAGNDPRGYDIGVLNLFPEYDGTNFPIGHLIDTGQTPTKWVPARPMKGDSNQWEVAARLDGGADGYEYCVYSAASLNYWNGIYPHSGEFRAPFTDSTFSYVDSNINNQEMSERALYLAAKSMLQWYSMPQRTVSVTTVGTRRPVRAGEKVWLDYNRYGVDQQGAFAEVDETGSYFVVSVVRQYGDVVVDTWTLSSNSRQPPDATSLANDSTRGLVEALRLIPTTSVAIYPLDTGRVKIDSQHPLVKRWELPATTFRVQQAKVLVTLFNVRHDLSQTTDDGGHTHDVVIPPVTVTGTLVAIDESPYNGATFGPQNTHSHPNTGATAQGAQNIGVGANQWGHNHGGSSPASRYSTGGNGGVAESTVDDITNAIRTHNHSFTIIGGGAPSALSDGVVYLRSGNAGQSGAYHFQVAGQQTMMYTSYPGDWSATGKHGHGDNIGVTGGGTVSGANLQNPALGTNNYSGLVPSVNSTGTGFGVHSQFPGAPIGATQEQTVSTNGARLNGAHHHTFKVGIYEDSFPWRVRFECDPGDGTTIDLGNRLGWNGTQSMSASLDFTSVVENSGGKVVTFTITGVGIAGNNDGLAEVEMSGFGVVELSAVGSQVLQA